ncbi:MAG: hypothetical protein IJC34_01355 [Lentisphaeria bacterium]|nr:hypothetical protein [Lentisphaeria bacterium]MBQ7394262.1 hypothetical protein [Lentisphaeria bacterium]
MKKYMEELAALPVRYFCNYCLLGGLGILFELLVFGIRSGWIVSAEIQAMAAATMLVTILQTAAEYFIPEGNAPFLYRLGAALGHLIFFSALILLQIEADMSVSIVCGLLGLLFWALVFCQIRFPGKGNFLMLPSLFFCIFLLLPALADGQMWIMAPKTLIVGNILLFLFACFAWHGRNRNATRKEQTL